MTTRKNNTDIAFDKKFDISEIDKILIIVANWNSQITHSLRDDAIAKLKAAGLKDEQILIKHVPGCFELTSATVIALDHLFFDVVIVLGCVIQGETRHFDFICNSVTQGITSLSINYSVPIIFGVLTTQNLQQAIDRAGGKLGNKGGECAIAALEMIEYVNSVEELAEEEYLFDDDEEEEFEKDFYEDGSDFFKKS